MPSKPKKPTRRRENASLLTEEMKTFIHLSIKEGEAAAAKTMGLKAEDAKGLLRQKPVQDYLKQYRHAFLKRMAAYEVGRITRFPVSRDDVVGNLLALAMLPPAETRGSIEHQVGALMGIAKILGMEFSPRDADDFFKGKTPEQLRDYAIYGKFDVTDEEKKADAPSKPADPH